MRQHDHKFAQGSIFYSKKRLDEAYHMQINFGHEKMVVLKNEKGIEAHILTLGAIVQSLKVLDKEGELEDVILGFDDLEPYKVIAHIASKPSIKMISHTVKTSFCP